jgi:hypothetical protein
MSMRRPAKCMAHGGICIGPSTKWVVWWIPWEARNGIGKQLSGFSSRRLRWLVIRQSLSPQRGTVAMHGLLVRSWATLSNIEPTRPSRIVSSKITGASNSDTLPCAALEPSRQRRVFVVTRDELRKYFRSRRSMGKSISLSQRRRAFLNQLVALPILLQAAS